MKLFAQDRLWLLKRWVIFSVALIILLSILLGFAQRVQPQIIHTLGSSNIDANVSWLIREVFVEATSNGSGVVYAIPISTDSLMAIDSGNGMTIWKVDLPPEMGGARELLANQDKVFVATSIFMNGFDASTGKLEWSTKLGDGHTTVLSQIDNGILVVYYGNKLIEINPETGEILSTKLKSTTSWISGDVILQPIAINQWGAIDRNSGKTLWDYPSSEFYLDENMEPRNVGYGNLIVNSPGGICLLDLHTGTFEWCQSEIDIKNFAIDSKAQEGFAMRDDLVLLTIDLQTGDILGKTLFLSNKPIDELNNPLSSITFNNGVLVISFFDSGQTFGVEIK